MYTVKKFLQKNQKKQIQGMKRNFRLILDLWMNLISTISEKLYLLTNPQVAFSENWEYNSGDCMLRYSKEKFRCFDLKPDGPFLAVFLIVT